MLILSRREGDSILLDGGIRIVVIACDRRGVRIGIEAPPEVSIVRGEIVNQIADENRRATASPGAAAFLGTAIPAVPATGVPATGAPATAAPATAVPADSTPPSIPRPEP